MGAAFKRLKLDNGKYSKLQQFVIILSGCLVSEMGAALHYVRDKKIYITCFV